jgi:hypothetical protein
MHHTLHMNYRMRLTAPDHAWPRTSTSPPDAARTRFLLSK